MSNDNAQSEADQKPAVGAPVERGVRPDPMRDAFEAWYSNGGKWPQAFRRSGESYVYAECAHAWTVWQAAAAYERQRCAAIAAPERFVYGDDEWRVRCEVRDAILEA